MKIVQINTTCGKGSTGKICLSISRQLTQRSIENYVLCAFSPGDYPLGIGYMNPLEVKLQALCSRIFGNYGFNSRGATKRLIRHLERIRPDVVHLHNLHSHNCNLTMLFEYFKKKKIKLFWTFHDCWAFTGYCTYYDIAGCEQWKTSCGHCPQKKGCSWFLDRSRQLFEKKKKLFSGLDLTVITPSRWLAEQAGQSFFRDYPIQVVYNGIDLNVFQSAASDFRKRYRLEGRYILMGVAFDWGARKGLDVFIELAGRLGPAYQIVLVGTNSRIDKKLPANIISVHRTQNQAELAELYTAADLFVNPTREEVLGLVNLEALACGTPVVTFNTGGSPECVDPSCGSVVERNDVEGLEQEIRRICVEKPYSAEACIRRAKQFSETEKYEGYLNCYFGSC